MMQNELGMQLHDRWTRGQVLTAQEQEQLKAWYQEQDALEAEYLNPLSVSEGIPELQSQIDVALAHLETSVQQVRRTTAANEKLRQEIAVLQQRLLVPKSA